MKNILILTISLVIAINCDGQNSISADKQKAIIEKVSSEINKLYFNGTIAKSIADTLEIIKTQIKIESTADNFANKVSSALLKKSNDNHLKLYFDPNKFESYAQNETAKRNYEYEAAKKINFGFTKVEILEGNVGYIEIIKFSGFIAEGSAPKINSAMNMVENTTALIIDLRKNGGGDGRVGDILATYFYPEENEIYYDSISRTEKFKVLPFVQGKRYLNRPVYILTGFETFSAAEGFCQFMQQNKKAIIIGEKTKGGGSSGSSVPLLEGFLCFIPTSFGSKDNDASVTPDHKTEDKNALNYAKYLFYKEEIKKNLTTKEQEIAKWNLKTCEYLLKLNDKNFVLNKSFIGNYENDRKVFIKNGHPLISFNDKEYKLAQIEENEFIILGFEDNFGAGNRRIIFNTKGFEEIIYFSGQLLNKFWGKL
jgi:C-terminal processing protease CtpA/Prc